MLNNVDRIVCERFDPWHSYLWHPVSCSFEAVCSQPFTVTWPAKREFLSEDKYQNISKIIFYDSDVCLSNHAQLPEYKYSTSGWLFAGKVMKGGSPCQGSPARSQSASCHLVPESFARFYTSTFSEHPALRPVVLRCSSVGMINPLPSTLSIRYFLLQKKACSTGESFVEQYNPRGRSARHRAAARGRSAARAARRTSRTSLVLQESPLDRQPPSIGSTLCRIRAPIHGRISLAFR